MDSHFGMFHAEHFAHVFRKEHLAVSHYSFSFT